MNASWTIVSSPPTVGYWILVPGPYSFKFAVSYKPNWFHRAMIKLCFGIGWEDV